VRPRFGRRESGRRTGRPPACSVLTSVPRGARSAHFVTTLGATGRDLGQPLFAAVLEPRVHRRLFLAAIAAAAKNVGFAAAVRTGTRLDLQPLAEGLPVAGLQRLDERPIRFALAVPPAEMGSPEQAAMVATIPRTFFHDTPGREKNLDGAARIASASRLTSQKLPEISSPNGCCRIVGEVSSTALRQSAVNSLPWPGIDHEAPLGKRSGAIESAGDGAECRLGQSHAGLVGSVQQMHDRSHAAPGHGLRPGQGGFDGIQQRAVPMVFQDAPARRGGRLYLLW